MPIETLVRNLDLDDYDVKNTAKLQHTPILFDAFDLSVFGEFYLWVGIYQS